MKKPTDIAVSCRCGNVRGLIRNVTAETCNHAVCLCDDCQAYAKFLNAPDALDANGGTELTQVGHNQVDITEGRDQLGCVRLSPKGMFRWYARCCNTPIANTLGAKSVFAGVVHTCVRTPVGGSSLESVIGPIRERFQGKFGKGELPPGTKQTVSGAMVWWMLRNLTRWWLTGSSAPSTFFSDGNPCVSPRILSVEERRALA